MVAKTAGKKLTKRTRNKQSFNKFVESDYTDFDAFKKACKDDENLLIYTCLTQEELKPFIEEIRNIDTIEGKLKYLKDTKVQPAMNATEARYDICVESIASYLRNYIAFNGFKMNNSSGDAEDWTSEFWLKYVKICNFYRDRWFHPENLKKASTVVYNTMLYKEFIYICRMSITGERRHQAFLATQKPESSLFKPSLDFNLEGKSNNTDRSLMDITKDTKNDASNVMEDVHMNKLIEKALEYAKQYENGHYYKQIQDIYINQEVKGVNKKVLILSKIFLYKAGLVAPKTLAFIKSLSNTYKAKFNISNSLVTRQLNEYKKKKVHKVPNYSDILEDNGETRLGLLLRKRSVTE